MQNSILNFQASFCFYIESINTEAGLQCSSVTKEHMSVDGLLSGVCSVNVQSEHMWSRQNGSTVVLILLDLSSASLGIHWTGWNHIFPPSRNQCPLKQCHLNQLLAFVVPWGSVPIYKTSWWYWHSARGAKSWIRWWHPNVPSNETAARLYLSGNRKNQKRTWVDED